MKQWRAIMPVLLMFGLLVVLVGSVYWMMKDHNQGATLAAPKAAPANPSQ